MNPSQKNYIIVNLQERIIKSFPSKKPHELDLRDQLIHSLVKHSPISIQSESKPNLLQAVKNIGFPHIFVIPPAIAKAELSVNEVITRPEPIAQGDGLEPQIVVHIVGVFNIFKVHQNSAVVFGAGWEIVLMKRRLESKRILEAFVGLNRCLLPVPADFEHQTLVPLIKCKKPRHPFGDSDCLPIDIAFFSHPIDVVGNKNVMAVYIHLVFSEQQEVIDHQYGCTRTPDSYVKVIGFGAFALDLPLYPTEKQTPKRVRLSFIYLLLHPCPKFGHNNNQQCAQKSFPSSLASTGDSAFFLPALVVVIITRLVHRVHDVTTPTVVVR